MSTTLDLTLLPRARQAGLPVWERRGAPAQEEEQR